MGKGHVPYSNVNARVHMRSVNAASKRRDCSEETPPPKALWPHPMASKSITCLPACLRAAQASGEHESERANERASEQASE